VDSPYFFLSNGIMPNILFGRIESWTAKPIIKNNKSYFAEAIPISANTYALRSFSEKKKGYELGILSKVDTPYFHFKYGILEKQLDGLFCVEGKLHFDKTLGKLVYLYSYRNQYIVMDSNLNIEYRGNTIDTFSRARMKVAHIASKNQNVLASPPTRTNGKSCVSDKYLFVQSHLLSKSEDKERFLKSAVIDVYDLITGSYLQSFYINNHLNYKLSDFKVWNNQVVALFDKYMVIYDVDLPSLGK
jgi:hypothetical protein